MRRRVLLYLTLIAVSACSGNDATQPGSDPATSPRQSISDGNNHGGNVDFFFLPPMVKDPAGSTAWNDGAFNATLRPQVEICDLVASDEAAAAAAPCHSTTSYPATLNGAEHYAYNWKVPTDASVTFYRIAVRVGTRQLGFADVETRANGGQLKNVTTGEFVPLQDGRTLPIKFRVERYALCETPGQPTCATEAVDLGSGGTVSTPLTDTGLESGVVLPAQPPPTNGTAPTVTVTVQSCGDFHGRELTDLPTFGPCVRVVVEPALTGPLTNAALVFSCDVNEAAVAAGVQDHEQAERIALHRLTPRGSLEALPHETPQCASPVATTGTLRGMFAALAHGDVKRAAGQMVSMLSPRPLYAATRFIDLGGGGRSFLSDAGDAGVSRSSTTSARLTLIDAAPSATINEFQFALPSKFQVDATPAISGFPGSTSTVAVKVTDLGGAPVQGARVRFSTDDGKLLSDVVVHTALPGIATVDWQLGDDAGVGALTATGRGIGGTNANGPRAGVDPFQPLDAHWDGTGVARGAPIRLGDGTLTILATKLVTGFELRDAVWNLDGFWQVGTLAGLSNALVPSIVSLAAGDASSALPTPPVGARALWFGSTGGNYRGAPGNVTQLGGTSADARSGTAASAAFLVPTTSDDVTLTFRSWFEIESVNPSAWDSMTVSIEDVNTGATTQLQPSPRLNPLNDPGGSAKIPFTSGGFNRPPVWTVETVNISAFKGRQVRVLFRFNTVDALYNGFRGWVVDDVALRHGTASSALRMPSTPTFDVAPTATAAPREYRP